MNKMGVTRIRFNDDEFELKSYYYDTCEGTKYIDIYHKFNDALIHENWSQIVTDSSGDQIGSVLVYKNDIDGYQKSLSFIIRAVGEPIMFVDIKYAMDPDDPGQYYNQNSIEVTAKDAECNTVYARGYTVCSFDKQDCALFVGYRNERIKSNWSIVDINKVGEMKEEYYESNECNG